MCDDDETDGRHYCAKHEVRYILFFIFPPNMKYIRIVSYCILVSWTCIIMVLNYRISGLDIYHNGAKLYHNGTKLHVHIIMVPNYGGRISTDQFHICLYKIMEVR